MLIDLVLNPDPAFEVRFENLKRTEVEISAELFIPEFRAGRTSTFGEKLPF
jgi:hypothetical protein